MVLNENEKKLSTRPTQDQKVFFGDFKSVFLKILAVQAWNLAATQLCHISSIQAVSAVLLRWWIPCPYS